MKAITQNNLKDAFAGESQAHMKYTIFADVAEAEGLPEVARLFRAIAYAERVHATNHLRELGGIGNTAANLQTGIDGEHFEVTEMYPAYHAVAKLQEEKGAMLSTHYALEAEKIHEALYTEAKQLVEAGKDLKGAPIYICPKCGYTVIGDPPDKCPVCSLSKKEFRQF